MKTKIALILILFFFVCSYAQAQKNDLNEKESYTLFNPTPPDQLREMSTDRPDKTESPYTVDAGHFQIEASFLDYSYRRADDELGLTKTETFSVFPMNLKAGLLNNMDFQLVINPYIEELTKDPTQIQRKKGVGDLQTRLKINFWGNDSGNTAFAMMPFLKFPTNGANLGNDDLEGGLILPLAISLPDEWSLGLMTEFDFTKNVDDDYSTAFINSITLGHAIYGNLNGYIEFFSNINDDEPSNWICTIDAGLTYALNENHQLDVGMNFGVTEAADDFNPFVGMSSRF